MSGNAKFRFLLASILVVIVGCVTTPPYIKYSNPSQVTIEQINWGMRPNLSPEVRAVAAKYCKEQGKFSEFTGIIRPSGVGPEEFDFRCVNYPNPQQLQTEKEPSPQSRTGSGFFVSKMGHVITNAHVVKNCNKVTVGDNANKQVPAELINTDRTNDLALLKLSTLEMASVESKSPIQKLSIVVVPLASKGLLRSKDVRLGEKVLVAGYPFGELFSNTIKVTSGIVSATRGAGDDSGQFQLDAAVQPGNKRWAYL